VEEDNRRICKWCFEYLVQNEGEKDTAFKIRNFCNKSHAGFHAGEALRKVARAKRKRLINDFTAPTQFNNGRD
jgi:hypothetical protein